MSTAATTLASLARQFLARRAPARTAPRARTQKNTMHEVRLEKTFVERCGAAESNDRSFGRSSSKGRICEASALNYKLYPGSQRPPILTRTNNRISTSGPASRRRPLLMRPQRATLCSIEFLCTSCRAINHYCMILPINTPDDRTVTCLAVHSLRTRQLLAPPRHRAEPGRRLGMKKRKEDRLQCICHTTIQ